MQPEVETFDLKLGIPMKILLNKIRENEQPKLNELCSKFNLISMYFRHNFHSNFFSSISHQEIVGFLTKSLQ